MQAEVPSALVDLLCCRKDREPNHACIMPARRCSEPTLSALCSLPCAAQALVDLQGRFFGGREVEASFFEEERFERKDLAPRPEEVRR